MGANTFGTYFQASTFGESHGPALGVVIEGCPAGVPFSWELLQQKLEQRRPGRFAWTSARQEKDQPELLSGVFEGRTIGTPIALIVKNQDARPEDYDHIKDHPRIGHADDVWKKKFNWVDPRGGGRASGRETISRVIAGAIAQMFLKQILPPLRIIAFPIQIGPFKRTDFPKPDEVNEQKWFGGQSLEVEKFLVEQKQKGLSHGGALRVEILHAPTGLGQPVFHKLKSDLAAAFMSIGACYAVTLGEEQDIYLKEGSQLHTQQNADIYGGIRGGISTGEKIIFQLKFKPPASVLHIAKKGRHDPCIVPRAAAVAEAMAWLVIADHVLWTRLDK